MSMASRLAAFASRDGTASGKRARSEATRVGFEVFGAQREDVRRDAVVSADLVRDTLATLVPRTMSVCAAPIAFDLETTGIGRDAVPFLVGMVGFDVRGNPWLRQWQLGDLDGEREMWCSVIDTLRALEPGTPMVTYNGASFDRPLVRTRMRRLGLWDDAMEAAFGERHHDLLPVCRRVWRDVLPDVRLVTLERSVLGVRRHGDPDGAAIATDGQAWIDGARGPAITARIAAIRRHNAWDLEGLLALVPAVAGVVTSPSDVQQAAAAAKHAERIGDREAFVQVCERWADAARRDAIHGASLLLRWIDHLRRTGSHDRAHELLRSLCTIDPRNLQARTKLAIDYEHRLGQPEHALALLEGEPLACPHRVARLQRRVADQILRERGQNPRERGQGPRADAREHADVLCSGAREPQPAIAARRVRLPGTWRAAALPRDRPV